MRNALSFLRFVKTGLGQRQETLLTRAFSHSGYPELATFLGVPEPSKSYPRVNSTAELKTLLSIFWVVAAVLLVGGPALALYLALRLARLCSSSSSGRAKEQ